MRSGDLYEKKGVCLVFEGENAGAEAAGREWSGGGGDEHREVEHGQYRRVPHSAVHQIITS